MTNTAATESALPAIISFFLLWFLIWMAYGTKIESLAERLVEVQMFAAKQESRCRCRCR